MKKSKILLIPISLISLIGCNATGFNASFTSDLINKVTVGSTINFANYLNYDNGVDLTITYSTNKIQNATYQSIYFLTSEVSVHNFTFTFTKQGKKKELKCSIDVVANAPTIQESTNAVFVDINDTVDFESLFDESGIDAMPFGYVDVDFIGVRYTPSYSSEYVSLINTQESVYTPINKNEKEYTFNQYGKYVFDLDINNSEGHVYTSLQVSVLNKTSQTIEGMTSNGLVKGNDNVVQLVRSNLMSTLSYLYESSPMDLDETKEYTIRSEFIGKNAPQIMLLSDTPNGKKYSGKGFVVSLEEDSKNQFGIYGYNRLNSANQSPKRSEGNTFSRRTLLDGVNYAWEVTFRKTKQDDNSYKLAIRSDLYKENELYREYSWVSLSVGSFDESYFGYLGSSLDDITFKYYPMIVKEAL